MTGPRAMSGASPRAAVMLLLLSALVAQGQETLRSPAPPLFGVLSDGSRLPSGVELTRLPITLPIELGVASLDASVLFGPRPTGDSHLRLRPRAGAVQLELAAGVSAWTSDGLKAVGALLASFGWGPVRISGGVERTTAFIPRHAAGDAGKPWVLEGTVSTPATPHDTFTAAEVTSRVDGSTVTRRAITSAVIEAAAWWMQTEWRARIGMVSAACCDSLARPGRHPWLEASLERRLSDRFSLIGRAGSANRSQVAAATGRPMFMLGLGILPRRPPDSISTKFPVPTQHTRASAGAFTFVWSDSGDGGRVGVARVHVTVDAPSAARVTIRGDFSSWSPVELHHAASGTWEAELRVPRGLVLVSVRIDDGPWGPPPGVARGVDDYGEPVGVILLEGTPEEAGR